MIEPLVLYKLAKWTLIAMISTKTVSYMTLNSEVKTVCKLSQMSSHKWNTKSSIIF
jgi:hypothetical protein